MNRLEGLDALRGLAAMLVVLQHTLWFMFDSGQAWAGVVVTTVDLGKLGVSIFFLISGFVIPLSFGRGLVAFGIGRAARLFPALWLSIGFAILLGMQVDSQYQLLGNALMLTHTLSVGNIVAPYWTLNWELYFYFVAAAAFAAGRLQSSSFFGLLAISTVFVSVIDPRFTYLIFMFVGALLRMVLLERDRGARVWLLTAIGALVLAVGLWSVLGDHPPEFFAGLALALPLFLWFWNRATHPAFVWLGSISYSLYLFHYPILEVLSHSNLNPIVFGSLGLLFSVVCSAAVFYSVEKPFLKIGKALTMRMAKTSQNSIKIARDAVANGPTK